MRLKTNRKYYFKYYYGDIGYIQFGYFLKLGRVKKTGTQGKRYQYWGNYYLVNTKGEPVPDNMYSATTEYPFTTTKSVIKTKTIITKKEYQALQILLGPVQIKKEALT